MLRMEQEKRFNIHPQQFQSIIQLTNFCQHHDYTCSIWLSILQSEGGSNHFHIMEKFLVIIILSSTIHFEGHRDCMYVTTVSHSIFT